MSEGIKDHDEWAYGLLKLERAPVIEIPALGHILPFDGVRKLVHARGLFTPIDPVRRRMVLGAQQVVTPTDEGGRVFGALWFNSDEFQRLRDSYHFPRKVSVFVDPDDLAVATIVFEGAKYPVDVRLQTTVFADLNLKQVVDLLQVWRREDPRATQVHEDPLCQLRKDRQEMLKKMEVERHVPRSYFTIEELKKKSEAIIAGAAVLPSAARNVHRTFPVPRW